MKDRSTRFRGAGSVVSLAVLLALTGCGGGGGSDDPELAAKGPPDHSNSQLSSVAVANTCVLDTSGAKPVLLVTTTITDKSSGEISAYLSDPGITVVGEEKGKGKDAYAMLGMESIPGEIGVNTIPIQLCNDEGGYIGPTDTVSLNASVTVSVMNDNKDDYFSRCSDDPDTPDVDEGKVVVSASELDILCSN